MSGDAPRQLFRQEALDQQGRSQAQGSLLRLTPTWSRVAYWLVLLLCLTVGVGLAVVDIHDYAQGPVLVQVKGLEEISSTLQGRVNRVLVKRGQQVREGDPLVELYSRGEVADVERANEEFRTQLATQLMDPQDGAARQSLTSLRTQLELSGARLAERTLKAPVSGVIRDIRVREGQYLSMGDMVATLKREGTESYALALVPGHYRPLLHEGQTLRMELNGFAYSYEDAEVTSVSDELLGPAEVKRYLGPDLGDTFTVEGPVVAVEARLPRDTLRVQGYDYRLHNGMLGTARVRVRSRNGWSLLIPAVELLRRNRG
jgi:membrane fusion protein, multidrug efflux system